MSVDTVTVACKLPNGLLLRIFEWVDSQEPSPGGGYKKVKVARQLPPVYELKGCATRPDRPVKHLIVAGAALTPGIPREFWDKWLEQNKGSDLVEKGLIFAHGETLSVEDMAKDVARETTGLEPLAQKDDPRAPKSIKKGDEE